jgi:hypothetical protein|tara:strand:- start:4420 stop:4638 length:219 start_codon:yes stop_codon:yes gene_type:complete
MGKTLKIIVDKINSLFTPPKEPVETREEQLAPPLTYYTMDVAATDNYDDNHFYNDLDSLEKPYEVSEDYEEV